VASGPVSPPPAVGERLVKDGPWTASQAFFAGLPDHPASARRQKWGIPAGRQVRALIAIVPDPVRTHMALNFDRVLEGLQLAAEKAGFVIDRYWLPWPAPNAASAAGQAVHAAPPVEPDEMEPGVVLFRRNANQATAEPIVLFAFLVADMSTAGIDGTQFSKAVSYVDEVMCPDQEDPKAPCPAAQPVRVVGPSFSGSLSSLRRLTDASEHHFTAYSGSVSSACAIAEQGLLERWPEACQKPPRDYEAIRSHKLSFRTFVHGAESAIAHFVRSIPALDCTPPQIAMLSEAATTFGEAVVDRRLTMSEGCITTFAFPREIASLRNASRAGAGSPQQKTSSQPASGQAQFLPFDLTDRTNSSDAPPDYSQPQGPVSKEAVLMNIAASLRRAHYRYIGISGSNVLDVLFLTDFLRAVCPDARLFMIGGDLLFERQFDNAPYIGTLALTTYPLTDRTLVPGQARWGDAVPHLPFSDGYEQGQYEAALQTISELLGNCPTDHDRPPLWLMVVGDGGYWPVRLLSGETVDQQRLRLDAIDFTGAWQMLVVLISTIAALQIAIVLSASPFAPQFRDFALVTPAPVQRLFFIQVSFAALALGLALLLIPAWHYSDHTGGFERAGNVVLAAVCGVAFLVEVTGCLRWRWKGRIDGKASDASWRTLGLHLAGFGLVWGLTAFGAFEWWQLLGTGADTLYGFFLAYRSLHPLSGVSPITPTIPLLAAVYAWTLFEIWRLRFNDTLRPRLFQLNTESDLSDISRAADTRPYPGIHSEKQIVRGIKEYRLAPGYIVLFFGTLIVWLISFHPTNPFVLFENGPFATLFAGLFCLVVMLMLSAGLRMLQIWNGLRTLLSELERSTVRRTFKHLEDRNWSFWRQGGQDAEWVYMARSIESVARLQNADARHDPNCTLESSALLTACNTVLSRVKDVRDRVHKFRNGSRSFEALRSLVDYARALRRREADRSLQAASDAAGPGPGRDLETAIETLQESLAIALDRTLGILYGIWSAEFAPPAGENQEDGKKTALTPEARRLAGMEEYAALRYVAFIRGALAHLRHVMIFVAISFSLVLISLNTYSFEPHRSLIWSFTAIFFVTGFIIVGVLMQLHRDPIMSRIAGTSGNGLGVHFYLRIVAFGAVPLLTLVATNFPSLGRSLLSFLGPSLEALK